MAAYVVMQSPQRRVEGTMFLRDGFSVPAFLVAPFWLFWHRLWLEGTLVLLALITAGALGQVAGVESAGGVLSLLVFLYVGLEGNAIRMAALHRRGWTEAGLIDANSLANAEARFAFAARPALDVKTVAPTKSAANRSQLPDPVFGFWGSAGRR